MGADSIEGLVAVFPENDAGIERYIPQKERDSYDASDFAGPDRSFPITSQEQLEAAAHLIGHAADPAAVKAKAIAIAKRKGFTLPKAWQEDKDEKEDDGKRAAMSDHAMLYAPITRIDSEKREVEGVATSETVDSFGTIFSYEASKRAFQAWIERTANVREMHDRRAVAKGVGVYFDDEAKQVIVRTRVSRGAPDTWAKIEDGVLTGYSVGATNPVWETIERDGKKYPYLTSYQLTELSLVDNPSNPDAFGLAICRADGLTSLIDTTEPEEQPEPPEVPVIQEPEVVERAGARISSDTKSAIHGARDSALQSAMQMMKTCSCEDCAAMCAALDPDGDGDIDLTGADSTLDPDADAGKMAERIAEILLARMTQELHTPISRMHAIAGTFARSHAPDIDLSPIKQSLEDIVNRLATVPTQSSLDEVRSALAEVKGQVERIAAQPMPGGPILNGARPAEKTLGPSAMSPPPENTYAILERLQAAGVLDTQDKQVAAAALAVVPTRGRIG